MATMGRLWAGRLYGTNTGNLAAELNAADDGLLGTIRFMDDRYGPIVHRVKGKFENGKLSLEGTPEAVPEGQSAGIITASATLLDNGNLKGEWSSTIGTGGTFELFPHDPPNASNPNSLRRKSNCTSPVGRLVRSDFTYSTFQT